MSENNSGGHIAEYALIIVLMLAVAFVALTFFRPLIDEMLRVFAQWWSEGR